MKYWWIRHDNNKYKAPAPEGAVMLPDDFLVTGYVPDMTEQWYSFEFGKRDDRIIGDFCGLYNSAFFVNEQAKQALSDMFERNGRIYPVRCNNEKYYFVIIDTLHDAFDLPRSEYDTSGVPGPIEDHISRFFRVTLRRDFVTEDDVFRLKGSFALNSTLIVSDRFKQRYEQQELTGLMFRPTDGTGEAFRPKGP